MSNTLFHPRDALDVIKPGWSDSPEGQHLIKDSLWHFDNIYISTPAQDMFKESLPRALAEIARYALIDVAQVNDGSGIMWGYEWNLRPKIAAAGYSCIESHHELAAYVLEYYGELKKAGIRQIISSAPSVKVDWVNDHAFPVDERMYSDVYLSVELDHFASVRFLHVPDHEGWGIGGISRILVYAPTS